jgi:hypothetical protein
MQRPTVSRTILVPVATLTIGIALLNAALPFVFRNSKPVALIRKVAATTEADTVFLGNSVIAAGIDATVWNKTRVGNPAAELGLGSSYSPEHYLVWKQFLKRGGNPRTVYYGFFGLTLSEPAPKELSGNRSIANHLVDGSTIGLYAESFTDRLVFNLSRKIPYLVYRDNIWAKVEQGRRRVGNWGFAREDSNSMGRRDDFNALLESSDTRFSERCQRWVGKPFVAPIARLIADARARGVRVVLLEMPQPRRNRERLRTTSGWRAYQQWIGSLAASEGVEVIDASDWMDDSLFDDPVHLSESGAREFTRMLAERTIAQQRSGD